MNQFKRGSETEQSKPYYECPTCEKKQYNAEWIDWDGTRRIGYWGTEDRVGEIYLYCSPLCSLAMAIHVATVKIMGAG